jgi:hypothetical protein
MEVNRMTKKTVGTIVVTVLVIAVLFAGGYAIYRAGFIQGMAADPGGYLGMRFPRDLGDRFQGDLNNHFPDYHRRSMPMFGAYPGSWSIFAGWPGILLLAGVVALVVIAVNWIMNRDRATIQQAATTSAGAARLDRADTESGTEE